jgi:gluconolactonase
MAKGVRGMLFLGIVGCASAAPAKNGDFQPVAQERIIPAGARLELLWAEGEFTEGPALAPDGSIYFSDIGNRIMRFDPKTGQTGVYRPASGRANGLKFDAQGRLIACEGADGGNRRLSITGPSGDVRTLCDRWNGLRLNSPNDLSIDRAGRVYFTDPRYVGTEPREIDFEGVFLAHPDGTVLLATRECQKPNGILVSPDGKTVYVADTHSDPQGNHQLAAFSVASDGRLLGKRVLFDFGPNRRSIDGMTLGPDGNLYAMAGTKERAGLYVFGPQGENLAFFPTPGDPTNCCFGGGAESSTLYMTVEVGKKGSLYRLTLKTGR